MNKSQKIEIMSLSSEYSSLITRKYSTHSGNHELIFSSLCLLLTDRFDDVQWGCFSFDDWKLIFTIIKQEGVGPYLYKNLKTDIHENTQFDEQIKLLKGKCKSLYIQTVAQNTILFQELEHIIQIFLQSNIPLIPLKGAMLGCVAYDDIGTRPMGDLDVLVKVRDFDRAQTLLKQDGYVEEPYYSSDLNKEIGFNSHLYKKINNIKLELHWNLVAGKAINYSPNIELFWKNSVFSSWYSNDKSINNNFLRYLDPGSHILYQAAHLLIQHGVPNLNLLWLLDIELLVRKYSSQINWDSLLDQSIKLKWYRALITILDINYTFFNTPLDQSILGKIKTSAKLEPYENSLPTNLDAYKFERLSALLSQSQRSTRIKFIFLKIFPSIEYIQWKYQVNKTSKIFFAYIKYWAHLADRLLFIIGLKK